MEETYRLTKGMRRGVVLVWALITMAVTTTILGAMGAYYVHVGRVANVYMAQTSARFEAQRKIESVKAVVVQAVKEVLQGIQANEIVDKSGFRQRVGAALKRSGLFQQKGMRDNAEVYELKDDESVKVLLNDKGTIDIEATGTSSAGGITLSVTNSDRLDFGIGEWTSIENRSDLVSHPIFNYVYFANNYGHLESSGIVANGDVGSNDEFTIDGATINGYVYAYSNPRRDVSSVIHLKNSPHMWPYQAYIDNVAKEYPDSGSEDDSYTPTRPTNPYKTSGTTEVPWKGGYEYPKGTGSGGTSSESRTINQSVKGFYDASVSDYNNKKGKSNKVKDFKEGMQNRYENTSYSSKKMKNLFGAWKDSDLYVKDGKAKDDYTDRNGNFSWTKYKAALDSWYEENKYYGSSTGGTTGDASATVLLTVNTKCTTTDGTEKSVLNVMTNLVVLPNISDADLYRGFCMSNVVNVTNAYSGYSVTSQRGGSLKCENKYKETSSSYWGSTTTTKDQVWEYEYSDNKFRRYLTSVSITQGYDPNIMPFRNCEKYESSRYGGSWQASDVSGVREVERGSVILIGTEDYPIIINGPVYFDGDVLIRGFVTGQGTIYAGRNIHILGDITYMNPPHWPNAKSQNKLSSAEDIEKNRQENAKCDLLLLAARGNIVLGNYNETTYRYYYYYSYSDTSWMSIMTSWARNNSQISSRSQDIDDSEIGYPSSLRSFTCLMYLGEQNSKDDKVTVARGSSWGDSVYKFRKTDGLCYYQTRLHDDVISSFMQTSGYRRNRPHWPRWGWFFWFGRHSVYERSQDKGEITHIDAVLFANHAILGKVGGTTSKKFTLNGAMICRDEGALYGFKSRITGASVWLNWDMRVASDSAEGNSLVGITPDNDNEDFDLYFKTGTGTVKYNEQVHGTRTTDWRQVK